MEDHKLAPRRRVGLLILALALALLDHLQDLPPALPAPPTPVG